MVEADQQERGDRGQFPENEQGQEGIGHHKAQHGPHEHQDEREKASLMLMSLQIAAGIEHDQRAYARDQQRKGDGETIEKPGKIDRQARDPHIAPGQRLSTGDRSDKAGEMQKDESGGQGQHPCRVVFQRFCQHWCDGGGCKRQQQSEKCQPLAVCRHELSPIKFVFQDTFEKLTVT